MSVTASLQFARRSCTIDGLEVPRNNQQARTHDLGRDNSLLRLLV